MSDKIDDDLIKPRFELPAVEEFFCPESSGVAEDVLQDYGVFINGFSRDTCHSDSYMTCVHYERLTHCIKNIEAMYTPTKEQWEILLMHWLGNPNMQPPLRLVAFSLQTKYKLDAPDVNEEGWAVELL